MANPQPGEDVTREAGMPPFAARPWWEPEPPAFDPASTTLGTKRTADAFETTARTIAHKITAAAEHPAATPGCKVLADCADITLREAERLAVLLPAAELEERHRGLATYATFLELEAERGEIDPASIPASLDRVRERRIAQWPEDVRLIAWKRACNFLLALACITSDAAVELSAAYHASLPHQQGV